MMKATPLLTPRTYRLREDQDGWLQAVANKQGHGEKSVTLRILVDRAMKQALKRSSAA